VIPAWYLPPEERAARAQAAEERRIAAIRREEERKAFEEKMATAKQELWSSLTAAERDGFCTAARASVKGGLQPPAVAVAAIAKSMAWENRSRMNTIGFPERPGSTDITTYNQEVAESE
jgi:hypothetical protein